MWHWHGVKERVQGGLERRIGAPVGMLVTMHVAHCRCRLESTRALVLNNL